MSALENCFLEISERRNRIVEQVKQQADLFYQNLAAKCILEGIDLPPWLLRSNPQGFGKTGASVKGLYHENGMATRAVDPDNRRKSTPSTVPELGVMVNSTLDQRKRLEDNEELPHRTLSEVGASNRGLYHEDMMATSADPDNSKDLPLAHSPLVKKLCNELIDPASRIQRSKSRQKALQLRNSAQAETKGCSNRQNNSVKCVKDFSKVDRSDVAKKSHTPRSSFAAAQESHSNHKNDCNFASTGSKLVVPNSDDGNTHNQQGNAEAVIEGSPICRSKTSDSNPIMGVDFLLTMKPKQLAFDGMEGSKEKSLNKSRLAVSNTSPEATSGKKMSGISTLEMGGNGYDSTNIAASPYMSSLTRKVTGDSQGCSTKEFRTEDPVSVSPDAARQSLTEFDGRIRSAKLDSWPQVKKKKTEERRTNYFSSCLISKEFDFGDPTSILPDAETQSCMPNDRSLSGYKEEKSDTANASASSSFDGRFRSAELHSWPQAKRRKFEDRRTSYFSACPVSQVSPELYRIQMDAISLNSNAVPENITVKSSSVGTSETLPEGSYEYKASENIAKAEAPEKSTDETQIQDAISYKEQRDSTNAASSSTDELLRVPHVPSLSKDPAENEPEKGEPNSVCSSRLNREPDIADTEPQDAVVDDVKDVSVHLSDDTVSKEETQSGGQLPEGSNAYEASDNIAALEKSTDEGTQSQDAISYKEQSDSTDAASSSIDKLLRVPHSLSLSKEPAENEPEKGEPNNVCSSPLNRELDISDTEIKPWDAVVDDVKDVFVHLPDDTVPKEETQPGGQLPEGSNAYKASENIAKAEALEKSTHEGTQSQAEAEALEKSTDEGTQSQDAISYKGKSDSTDAASSLTHELLRNPHVSSLSKEPADESEPEDREPNNVCSSPLNRELNIADTEIEPWDAVVDDVKGVSVHLLDDTVSKEETQSGGQLSVGSNAFKASENITEAEALEKSTEEGTQSQEAISYKEPILEGFIIDTPIADGETDIGEPATNFGQVPILEGFFIDTPIADGETDIGEPAINFDRVEFLERVCKSANSIRPLSHFSSSSKLQVTQNLYQSLPNGLLEHGYLRSCLLPEDDNVIKQIRETSYSCADESEDSVAEIPYSDYPPSYRFGRKPGSQCHTPVGKFWARISLDSSFSSSGKGVSSNLELEPIEEDPSNCEENEATDDVAVRNSHVKNLPVADVTNSCQNPPASVSAAERFHSRKGSDSVCTVSHSKVKRKLGSSVRNMSGAKVKQASLVGAKGINQVTESFKRSSRQKLLSKLSTQSDRQNLSGKGSRSNNIVSNVTSFIPLVQQKQAAAKFTGKRDIKVKALEAAEAAKRLGEQRENERKKRKEAMEHERARLEQENSKKLAMEKKKKEEEKKKKEADVRERKRQREEEEKIEREKKRKRVEEARRQQKEQEGKTHVKRVEKDKGIPTVDHNKSTSCALKKSNGNTESTAEKSREKSYEMSPYRSDSEDEDDYPAVKKFIPSWASKANVFNAVLKQGINYKSIFPPDCFCSIEEVILPRRLQEHRYVAS